MTSRAHPQCLGAGMTESGDVIDSLGSAEVDRAYLATIIASSHDAIVSKDLNGVVTSWNAGAERLFGYTAAEAVGRPITFLLPPDREHEEEVILARLGRGEKVDHFESVRLTRDGRSIVVSLTISPIRDRRGRIIGISKIARDITRQKADEDALRSRQREFETLAEHSPLIITRFDRKFRHLYVNRVIEGVTGRSRDQFLGKTNRELGMPPDLCSLWEAKFRTTLETRREVDFEFSYEGRFGRRDFHSRLVPEFGADGHVASVLGVAADITDRKRLQAELLSIAERQQLAIGQDLHDDVGQELTGVALMCEALSDALQKDGSPEVVLMARICSRLGYVRDRIRSMARGLYPVEVDARGLMNVLEELTHRTTIDDRIEATFVCDFPVYVQDNHIATQLYRVAQEAIANAIKHANPERITVILALIDDRITLEVRDDGIGMASESRQRQGMGLKTMQYRADLIGATLDVDSIEGGGTRVICSIGGAL